MAFHRIYVAERGETIHAVCEIALNCAKDLSRTTGHEVICGLLFNETLVWVKPSDDPNDAVSRWFEKREGGAK